MQQHNVIAMTTTACAIRWEVLRTLEPEILICEEAGEVMEPHALCSLLPSLKHSIFIGDPLQLRPEVNEQLMTLETRIGSLYRLDESLFERIMMPRDPLASTLPTSQLNIQRRMHPQIAELSRITYPFLMDHDSTESHPRPKGIASRMFWLDHRIPETVEPDASDSVYNPHEAHLVKGFIQYLLRGSGYSYGDIAVLTPYAAQLSKLHETLQSTCSIWISEKDREMLLDNGQLDIECENTKGKTKVEMGNMLRVATVDNFQGEEAKVVILSTVRSGGTPGFMKSQNRINVACSRARDGFYIIGNAETLSQVEMWREVIGIFDTTAGRGSGLLLQCDRHPQHNINATCARDFELFEECTETCGTTLICGHLCQEKCHDLDLHDRIPCSQLCMSILSCGHPCPRTCADKCGFCDRVAETIVLECGHDGIRYCSGEITRCTQIVEERNLPCGRHTVEIQCGRQDRSYICAEKCGIALSCGHDCPGTCAGCKSSLKHQPCARTCETTLSCNHQCEAACHHGKDCPPCQKPCQEKCRHGRCRLSCSQPCDPCVRQAVPACSHQKSTNTICSFPNVVAPCSILCTKVLECGHVCQSLHNEVCLPRSACPQCQGQVTSQEALLYNPACGHTFDVKISDTLNLDTLFQADNAGILTRINTDEHESDVRQPLCPVCACALSVRRYEIVTKLRDFPNVFDRHLYKCGQQLGRLSSAVDLQETRLYKTFKHFMQGIRPTPQAAEVNASIILRRDSEIQALRSQIIETRDHVFIPFEQSVATLHQALPNRIPAYIMLFRLHADALEFRTMYAYISDKLRIISFLMSVDDFSNELQRQALTMLNFVHTECVAGVLYCQDAIETAALATNPSLEAEIRLQQVRFHLLAHNAFQQLTHAGSQAPALEMPVTRTDLILSLGHIEVAALHFPSTCKPYLNAVPGFRRILLKQEHLNESETSSDSSITTSNPVLAFSSFPSIHSPGARLVERQWSQHILGDLVVCEMMHPYSKQTFPEFCPECSKMEETEEEKIKRAQEHLFEKEFLVAIGMG